jgi:transposase
MPVPWATGKGGFTALFERIVIALLSEMSISAVARNLHLSWDEVDGIMSRAVERGLERRSERNYRFTGIDEKAIKKRHRYFTIVSLVIWARTRFVSAKLGVRRPSAIQLDHGSGANRVRLTNYLSAIVR